MDSATASVGVSWDKEVKREDEEIFCFKADQQQKRLSVQKSTPTKKPSLSPYSGMSAEGSLEKLMYEAGITDNQLAKFRIKVKVGDYEKEEIKNIKNGLRICFENNKERRIRNKEEFAKHEKRVYEELISECEDIFTCDYMDSVRKDEKLAKMLDSMKGGIVLKYSENTLKIYRLSQLRVFVQGDKVKRSIKDDITAKEVFSYTRFVEQLQKEEKLKPIVVALGKSDGRKLSVEITPFAQKVLSKYYHSNDNDVEDITANIRNLATIVMPL